MREQSSRLYAAEHEETIALRSQIADLNRQIDDLRIIHDKAADQRDQARVKAEKQHLEELRWANRRDNARLQQQVQELQRIGAADQDMINKLRAEISSLKAGAANLDSLRALKADNFALGKQ